MAFTEYFLGKKEQVSWGSESTYGSGVSPTRIVGKNVVITPDWSKGWQEVISAGASTRYIDSMVKGPEILKFTMDFIATDWVFFKYIYGASSDTNPGAYYLHTITTSNTIQSFTLEWAKRGASNIVYTLAGCFVIKGSINFAKATGPGAEGHIKVSLDCVAQTVSKGSSITTLTNTSTPFQYRQVKLTLNTSEIAPVNNGEITFDTGIDPNDSRYCNDTLDVKQGEPIPRTFKITGKANINVKDATYYDIWNAAVVVTGTNSLAFTRATNDDLVITFTNMYPLGGIDNTNLDGVSNVDFAYQAVSATVLAKDSISAY